MSREQWKAYGSPMMVTPAIVAAVRLIARVYDGSEWYPGNAAGGNLHTILDDWNIEFSGPYSPTYSDAPHQHAVERACHTQLRGMTIAERAAALPWYNGYITDAIPGAPIERSWSAGVR